LGVVEFLGAESVLVMDVQNELAISTIGLDH